MKLLTAIAKVIVVLIPTGFLAFSCWLLIQLDRTTESEKRTATLYCCGTTGEGQVEYIDVKPVAPPTDPSLLTLCISNAQWFGYSTMISTDELGRVTVRCAREGN